jgi:hypothetical protein
MKPGSHISCSQKCRKVWGNEPHTPKWTLTLGVGLPMASRIFRRQWQKLKFIALKNSLYHWKALKIGMFKMGSHDPFGYLKHKLWPKKMGKKSSWQFDFRALKVVSRPDLLAWRWHATHLWKALDESYNFSLDLISFKGSKKKLWAPKVARDPISGILGLDDISNKMAFGCWPCDQALRILKWGRWWLPPSLGCDVSCEFVFVNGSSVHKKFPTTH